MSEIALYNTLRKIPEVSDAEAKEAAAGVASSKDVATKTDIKDMATKVDIAEVKAEIAKLETRMTWKLVGIGVVIIGVIKYL